MAASLSANSSPTTPTKDRILPNTTNEEKVEASFGGPKAAKIAPSVQSQWEAADAKWMVDEYLFESSDLRHFIPQAPMDALMQHIKVEQSHADWVSNSLKQSWERVEEGQRRTTHRLTFLNTTLPALLKEHYACTTFWNNETFRTHFNLSSVLDGVPMFEEATDNNVDDTSFNKAQALTMDKRKDCIRIKKNWVQRDNNSSPASVIPKSSSKPPSAVPDRHLLRASSQFAPLRRSFTALLQNRSAYPKDMTLLFSGIEAVQNMLQSIEASMDHCMLHVPLYKPLQRIALCVARDLSRIPPGFAITEAFNKANGEILRSLIEAMKELLEGYEQEVGMVPAAATTAKGKLGAAMWGVLLTELNARKGLHERTIQYIENSLRAEQEMQTDLQSAVAACEKEVSALLSEMSTEAASIIQDVRATAVRVAEVSDKSQKIYASQKKQLETQIKESSYSASASAETQVKILRNIRQQFKELEREQLKHNLAMNDVMACHVNLAKLEATYQGLTAAATSRRAEMEEAETMCRLIEQMLSDTTSVCETLNTEMVNHTRRCIHAETMRKCGATKLAMDNAKEWRRITGDLAALYQHIDDEVSRKVRTEPDGSVTTTNSSWQLDFLLSNKRKVAAEKLQFIRDETKLMDQKWLQLASSYAEPYEVAVPDRLKLDEDPIIAAKRQLLIELEIARKYMRTKEVAALSFEVLAQRPKSLLEMVRNAQQVNFTHTHDSPDTQLSEGQEVIPSSTGTPSAAGPEEEEVKLSPSAAAVMATAKSLRDSSLTVRSIIPTFAKFEAELEALRTNHKMRNTSDYSKKLTRMDEGKRPLAEEAGNAQKVADAIAGAGTAAALLRTQRRASKSEEPNMDTSDEQNNDSFGAPPPPPRTTRPTDEGSSEVPIVPRPPPRRQL